MKMYIDGTEVLCDKNITITEEMLSTSSVILNNVFPKEWDTNKDYVSQFYFPKDYSKFTMYDKNDNLIFAGVVKNTGNISLNPREPHYATLQVLDFKTFLSEGETLDFVINNKTILEALKMVVDTIEDYGFALGNVDILNGDEVIGAYNTQNQTAYDVLQYLSEISGSRWFTRLDDENNVLIDFYDPSKMPMGTTIEYTNEFFKDNNIIDLKYNYSTNDYRNKQVMLSNDVYGSIDNVEVLYGNGYSNEFTLTENVANITSIYENGVSKTFASQEEKQMGMIADYYYQVGSNILESDTIIGAGINIRITYTPLVKGRQVIYNMEEVDRIATQTDRKGVIARYETRNDVLSSSELQSVGESYLKYKGTSEITLTIQTQDVNLWNIGQVVNWNEAPLEELQKSYMVKKKTINRIVAKNEIAIFYTFELSSSYNSESAINYFDNQRRKATGNIQEGQYIDRNIDIDNECSIIFDNIEENEIQYTNVLNCVLNAPFNL